MIELQDKTPINYTEWQYETCDNYAETMIRSTAVIIKYFF